VSECTYKYTNEGSGRKLHAASETFIRFQISKCSLMRNCLGDKHKQKTPKYKKRGSVIDN
jgi:hypothetical protein